MAIITQNGIEVTRFDNIVVFEHLPGLSISQWAVAVRNNTSQYDNPYDIIVWMPKTGYYPGPKHDERHANNKALAEMLAESIRRSFDE